MKKATKRYETSLRINAPSLTLSKHDIKDLGDIIDKAYVDSQDSGKNYNVSGGKEYVETMDLGQLISAKWPITVDTIDIGAFCSDKFMRAYLESGPRGASRVEISGTDSDWVTLRAKEVEEFFASHRNWHWVLFNITLVFAIGIIFGGLIGLATHFTFNMSFPNNIMVGVFAMMIIVYSTAGLTKIYPFVLIVTGHSSTYTIARKIINWLIPFIATTIVGELLWASIVR